MVWSEGVFAFYKPFCVTLLIYLPFKVLCPLRSAFSSGSTGRYYSLDSRGNSCFGLVFEVGVFSG